MWPKAANLADMGEPSMAESDRQKENDNNQNANPAMQEKDNGNNNSRSSNNGNSNDSMDMSERTLTIDELQPGQSASFSYAIRADNLDEIPTKVIATNLCNIDAAEEQAKASSKATAESNAVATMVRLPALQMIVYDDEDPVVDGTEVVYTIRVWNEGDADDSNVQISAMLPESLKFVSADGPTEVEQDGSTIKFAAIDTLEAGDEITYTVTADSQGEGAVSMKAQLTSKSLPSKVTGEEPTRIFTGKE